MTLRTDEVQEDDEDSGTTTEEDSDDGETIHHGPPLQIVQNVGGFMAKEDDKVGMALIMEQLFRTSNVDLGGLADLLITQPTVGCVSKPTESQYEDLDGEETFGPVCGVTSLINMVQHKDVLCVKQIVDWLKLKANEFGSETDQAIIQGLFDPGSHQTPGFLVKERVLNLPAVLMMVELVSLKKDVTKALAEGKPFHTTHIIQIIKMFKTPAGEQMFSHQEEVVATNHAICWFDYEIPVSAHGPVMYVDPETGVKTDCMPIRRVVIIPTTTFFSSFYQEFEAKVKENNPLAFYEDDTVA